MASRPQTLLKVAGERRANNGVGSGPRRHSFAKIPTVGERIVEIHSQRSIAKTK